MGPMRKQYFNSSGINIILSNLSTMWSSSGTNLLNKSILNDTEPTRFGIKITTPLHKVDTVDQDRALIENGLWHNTDSRYSGRKDVVPI